MSELREKIEEFESKNRKSKLLYALAIVGALVIFAVIYLMLQNESVVAETQTNKAIKLDSVTKTDSIKKQEINAETMEIQKLLDKLKRPASESQRMKTIAALEEKIGIIDGYSSDSTIVRYYLRPDSMAVKRSIRALKGQNFKLNTKEPFGNKDKLSNHLYYGTKVTEERKRMLLAQLKANGVNIKKVIPFFMGYKWKDESMEIGYDAIDEKAIAENGAFTIRIYNISEEDDEQKVLVGKLLEYKGYKVEVKPRMKSKDAPRFSKTATLHCFSKNRATLANAKEIQKILMDNMGEEVEIEFSENGSLSNAEKPVTFSIHYRRKN